MAKISVKNSILGIFIICSLNVERWVCLAQGQPEVTISQGTLSGSVSTSRDGRPFNQFLAIPFGKVGKRFERSTPADGWTGIRQATTYSPGCLLLDPVSLTLNGTDDCLDLDVYTPILPTDSSFEKPLPVMVYFTGGAFIYGASWYYTGSFIMDKDVVLVIPNYRLGPYGFLNVGIDEASGNQGVKDQVLALKWVRDNIDKFGGDPSKVTIFGESAGSASVSLHVLSPMSRGLFSRAIMQSGLTPCVYDSQRSIDGMSFAKALAADVDCPTRDLKSLVECLQNVDPLEVLTAMTLSFGPFLSDKLGQIFGPTYETYSTGEDDPNVLINEDAFTLFQRGDFERVPMIIGHTSHEAYATIYSIFSDPANIEELNKKFGRVLPKILMYKDSADDPCAITERIREYFLQGRNVTSDDLAILETMMTDRKQGYCTRKMSTEISKFSPVYLYNFTQKHSIFGGDPPSHSEDVGYLFATEYLFPIEIGSVEYEFSKHMIDLWTSFATDGQPGRLWGSAEGVEWTPLSQESQQWLQLNIEPSLAGIDATIESNNQFWDSLPLNEYGKNSSAGVLSSRHIKSLFI